MTEAKKTTSKPIGTGKMPGGGRTPSAEKPKDLKSTLSRLGRMMFEYKVRLAIVLVALIVAAGLSAVAPKALGNATNTLFDGLMSKTVTKAIESELPAGSSLSSVKSTISDADGYLSVEKLKALIEQKEKLAVTQKNTTESNSQAQHPKDGLVVDSGVSKGSVDISKIENMLSTMKIKIGSSVDFTKFALLLLWVAVIYLLSFLLRSIAGWISVRIISEVGRTLRQRIEEKLWKLPLSYFDKTSRGEIMSRTTNDLDNVTQTLNQVGGDIIYMSFMVISVVVMMFTVSPLLAVIALLTIPVSFSIIGLIMKKSQPQFKAQWKITGELNGNIEESFTGHSIIKAYGQREKFMDKFTKQNDELFEASFKAQFISGTIMPVMTFVTNLNYVVIAIIGAVRVSNGMMSLGDVQAFVQYSRQYSQPLGQISQMMNLLQSGSASAERIFELLDEDEEADESALDQSKFETTGHIEFQDVDFSYDPEVPLIEGLNLTANPGQTIAIVGPTGAGKTTVLNLIMRYYDIDSGKILLNDVETRSISRHALRSNIGMVLQDTWLFGGTIEENLKYSLPDSMTVTDEEFYATMRATYVDHFVKSLPDGYQTVLNDEASTLSAGEKQLLTIARAFLANPDILILDEATSSVDTRTEVLIQKAMNALRSNRTSFVIAHRLSTIRDADIILFMEHGHIVEQGNHVDLIGSGGKYAKLYQSQFENNDTDEETA
ncbi:MAG: ABC transporter ATP-binding protein/permease [Candidatus Ancillula sp.]|jgi:ATP-binding cassette subfamily B protein|nr:ABC transporter ATP-binding protein/permease [Candidatus Ancillula sp.]